MKNKTQDLYEKFKDEAVLTTFVSTGPKPKKKKIIKFRGQIFFTGSFQEVFNSIKHRITFS